MRRIIASTAIAALLCSTAFAQETTTAPAVTSMAGESILATGYTVVDEDNLASEITGKQVYSSSADDAEHIGDVSDFVVGPDGNIAAVIIGVGGFLGIGQKGVAVNYAELEWVTAEDGTERFVLPTTKEALEAAPEFETVDPDEDAPAAPAAPGAAPAADPAVTPMAPAAPTN